MPTFKIRDKVTGEVFTIREKEPQAQPLKQYNVLGKAFTVPSGAIRRTIFRGKGEPIGQAYMRGALRPEETAGMQQQALDWYYGQLPSFPGKTALGMGVSAGGLAGDIITDPTALLSMMATGGIAKTRIGQAIGRFFTKPRKIFKFGRRAVQDIAEKASKGELTAISKMHDKYDDVLSKIGKGRIGADDMDDIASVADDIINKYPNAPGNSKVVKIYDRLTDPKIEEMTVNQLHALKQEVRTIVPKSVWKGSTRPNAMQHEQIRLYFKVNEKLAKAGGKQYTALANEYRDFINMLDDINRVILEAGRPGEAGLLRGRSFFRPGGALTYRQEEALRGLSKSLPPKQQFMQELAAWRRGQMLKRVAQAVAGGGLLYGARRRLGGAVFAPEGGGGEY